MKKILRLIFLAVGVFVAGIAALFAFAYFDFPYDAGNSFASILFPETVSSDILKSRYNRNIPVRILIVPGHDNDYQGTYFKGVWESDLTVEAAKELYALFEKDPRFEAFITRDENGYSSYFWNYFVENKNVIRAFRNQLRSVMNQLLWSGVVKRTNQVYHNWVEEEVSLRLYGINKWANDNKIDIIIHAHFNDVPRRENASGKYSGFALYVPEEELSNHRASYDIANAIYAQMKRYFPTSDYPPEASGIVRDQDLIAVGANASLNGVAILAEYGYVYESQFTDPSIRPLIMRELARQTYNGIKNYFEERVALQKETATLPYFWESPLTKGTRNNEDVFAMQIALATEELYPPSGSRANECPITGNFGSCTVRAVKAFQEKYGFAQTGSVGPQTVAALNALYSPTGMR